MFLAPEPACRGPALASRAVGGGQPAAGHGVNTVRAERRPCTEDQPLGEARDADSQPGHQLALALGIGGILTVLSLSVLACKMGQRDPPRDLELRKLECVTAFGKGAPREGGPVGGGLCIRVGALLSPAQAVLPLHNRLPADTAARLLSCVPVADVGGLHVTVAITLSPSFFIDV